MNYPPRDAYDFPPDEGSLLEDFDPGRCTPVVPARYVGEDHDTAPDFALESVHESLRPPPLPSGPSWRPPWEPSRAEVGLATVAMAGVLSCVYLAFEIAHHWQIGGWEGVAWITCVITAAAIAGAALALVCAMHGVRRG